MPDAPEPQLDRLRAELGVDEVAPSIVAYAAATHDVETLPGPWHLLGFGASSLRTTTCEKIFGKLGDTPFPAVCVGSDRHGIDFWLCLASGRVITLHEDASLFEVAGKCHGETAAALMAALVERGAAFDIAQLARLQSALHEAAWKTELERQQSWARAAANVLRVTLATMAKRAEYLPYVLLHLEPQVVGDLAIAPADKRGKRGAAGKLPPPLADALASGARTLDLAGLLGTKLPARIAELTDLEELDLSENPRLDFADAFTKLAALPRLRAVKFADCRLEELPEALGELAALEELDLSSSVLKGPSNFFALDQALPILRRLPRLRVLDARVCRGPSDMKAFVAALPALERLVLDSVGMPTRSLGLAYRDATFDVPASTTLEEVSVRRLDVDPFVETDPADFPRLRSLDLGDASVEPEGGYLEDEDYEDRQTRVAVRVERLIAWLARLPALRSLDLRLRSMDIEALPESIATVRVEELWLCARSIPAWIGRMSSLRALHLRYVRKPLPPAIGDLANLESLDAGGWGMDETCKLGALPESIGKLSRLRTLAVRNVEAWPETLRDCRTLEILDCGKTPPPFLGELTSLRRASGPLASLVQLPLLEELEMSGAKRVPARLSGLSNVRTVRWWAYDLEDDFDAALERILALPALDTLELAYIPRQTLPSTLLAPPLRTLRLGISDRNTPGLDLTALCSLLAQSRIEHLALRTDRPATLPEELTDLSTLRELELSGTGFVKLPASIGKLSRLRRLLLRQTKVGAPERKRLRTALPGCRITVYD